MHVPRRDLLATALVAVAVVFYVLWAADAALPGLRGTRATGLVVLALGFAASASAVVPAFDQLMHGNKLYLVVTSSIGLVALIAGIQMLVATSGAGLTVVLTAMVALWLLATIRHTTVAPAPRPASIHRHRPRPAGV